MQRARHRPARRPAAAERAEMPPWLGPALLGVLVAVGAAPRIWIALNDDGIYWPDEIYQSLEPAHRLVFGTGLTAWEFRDGGRSWAFPGLVAALMKAASLFGLNDPRGYVAFEKVAFALLALATVAGVYRLARAYRASPFAAACGASVFALAAMPIYFGPRALSENASALAVVFGFALALPPGAGRTSRFAGAAILGLSILFRLQNAIFVLGLLGALGFRRRGGLSDALTAVAAALAVYGFIDQLTWGSPFKSFATNLAVNLRLSADPTLLAEEAYAPPAPYYVTAIFTSMAAPAVAAAALAVAGARRAPALAVVAVAYVLAHTAVPHKELRFMLPLIPLLGALAGIGIHEVAQLGRREGWREPLAGAALLAAAGISAVGFHQLSFHDVGMLGGQALLDEAGALTVRSPQASAYDFPGPVNRLLVKVRTMPEVCGLKVESVFAEFQGGYTYLDRAIPLYRFGGPPRASGYFNFAIAQRARTKTGEIVASDGDMVLVRLADACVPDPSFNDHVSRGPWMGAGPGEA